MDEGKARGPAGIEKVIKAGDVFRARIDGQLVPLTKQRLTPEQTRAIALRLIPSEEDKERIEWLRDYDCSWGMPGVGRFRVNILRQRSSFMIVMRVIPFDVPSFESLQLPAVLQAVASVPQGIILVTGLAGSGKSSTMAAMVNHINQTAQRHIVTLESPIEFLHRDIKASVTQREVGVDTDDYRRGLRAALRQDPDVLLVGDMGDAGLLDTALKAAETGHLVISAVDTPDVVTTIHRLMTMSPPEEQQAIRVRLAQALRAIVSQRLVPRADGHGRAAAVEILIATGEVPDIIRDPERTEHLQVYIATSRAQFGMQTFDQHLVDLALAGTVTAEGAVAAATNRAEVETLTSGLRKRPAPQVASLSQIFPPS